MAAETRKLPNPYARRRDGGSRRVCLGPASFVRPWRELSPPVVPSRWPLMRVNARSQQARMVATSDGASASARTLVRSLAPNVCARWLRPPATKSKTLRRPWPRRVFSSRTNYPEAQALSPDRRTAAPAFRRPPGPPRSASASRSAPPAPSTRRAGSRPCWRRPPH